MCHIIVPNVSHVAKMHEPPASMFKGKFIWFSSIVMNLFCALYLVIKKTYLCMLEVGAYLFQVEPIYLHT